MSGLEQAVGWRVRCEGRVGSVGCEAEGPMTRAKGGAVALAGESYLNICQMPDGRWLCKACRAREGDAK